MTVGSAFSRYPITDELTLDEDDGSGLTVGAMAHIVADSVDGPRGNSPLTEDERRSYANLILLCSHHHDLVDTKPTEYPVESLHQMKATHEEWVANALASAPVVDPDPAGIVMAAIIDGVEGALPLNSWPLLSDSLVRDQMPMWLIDARGRINELLLRAAWPDPSHPVAKAAEDMGRKLSDYTVHFCTNSILKGKVLVADTTWKREVRDHSRREKCVIHEEQWSNRCFWMFSEWVVSLNQFAGAIRKHINPLYRIKEGHFLVYDDLGVRGDGVSSTMWKPTAEEVEHMKQHFEALRSAQNETGRRFPFAEE